jgi:cyclopropane fatty-acyl-phospholipid synthase-like methyltransferase
MLNPLNVLFNRIIKMNIILFIIGIVLYFYTKNWLCLLIVFFVFVLNETIFSNFGIDSYFSHDRTELIYSSGTFFDIISPELQNVKSNLTEGFYPDKTAISTEESETNRFNEFIRILDIQPGDTVLDAGCGHGGLVAYLRSKGFDAYGLTITKYQYVENCKKHGKYFYYCDYTEFQSYLANRFDHIILPGSLEHPFGGNHSLESSYEKKFNGMRKMFTFMKKYFKESSTKKKILTTCLHLNPKFKDTTETYIMERCMGCLYPPIGQLSVSDSLKTAGYEVLLNEDYTWHYYFATVCDPDHFGYPRNVGTIFTLMTCWLYPIMFYIYYGGITGIWMWQFDGNAHYPDDPQFTYVEDINERPCTLFYTVAQLMDKSSVVEIKPIDVILSPVLSPVLSPDLSTIDTTNN